MRRSDYFTIRSSTSPPPFSNSIPVIFPFISTRHNFPPFLLNLKLESEPLSKNLSPLGAKNPKGWRRWLSSNHDPRVFNRTYERAGSIMRLRRGIALNPHGSFAVKFSRAKQQVPIRRETYANEQPYLNLVVPPLSAGEYLLTVSGESADNAFHLNITP